MAKTNTISRVKISKKLFKQISGLVLDTLKIDDYTKNELKSKVIEKGYCRYIGLIKKHIGFLTPLRLMILVDYVDILDALNYYFRDFNLSKYKKLIDYNLIIGLHSVEFKLIILENIFEMFDEKDNIDVVFHMKEQGYDLIVTVSDKKFIKISDSEGYLYETTLKPGKYSFESRPCSSISDTKYILNDEKRKENAQRFDRHFLVVPKDADIYDGVMNELEKNNIKITYSKLGTIDIVNDVLYMEGMLKDNNSGGYYDWF